MKEGFIYTMNAYIFIEKGEAVKIAPSPLMPRKERTGGAAKRANSLRLNRGKEMD